MSKHTVRALSLLTAVTMLLAACGQAAPTPAPTAPPAAQQQKAAEPTKAPEKAAEATKAPAAQPKAQVGKVPVSGPNEFPVVKEKVTLKIFVNPRPEVKDYKDNEFTRWVEQKTNLNLEFIVPPVAEAMQKLNLIWASEDLPDIVMGGGTGLTLDQQQILAEQKLIIPLNDLIDQYGYEFKTALKEVPATKDLITLRDGKIYALPDINECYHCTMSQKMWVYKPWLDKLGLQVPTTTEEFYQMLKAFKEKDPNGNGKADEIALSGSLQGPNSGWMAQYDSFLMNSFVYNDRISPNGSRHLMLDNGNIKAAYTEPGWREGLKYLNKLYAEGLMDPQGFTNDSNKIRQLGENPDAPILGAMQAGWYGVFTQNGGPSGRWKDYVPISPLKGPSGMQQTPRSPYQPFGQGFFLITKACKNPEAAMRLADLFYSFEATTRSIMGVKGEDWVDAKPDEVSISGGKALYTVLLTWGGEQQNRNWLQTAPSFRTSAYRLAQTYNPKDPLERILYENTKSKMEPYGVTDKAVPPLVFTKDQAKQFAELKTIVESTLDQWFADFVTGKKSPDKDWDAYLKAMKDAGLDKFLALYQDAYNVKYKK